MATFAFKNPELRGTSRVVGNNIFIHPDGKVVNDGAVIEVTEDGFGLTTTELKCTVQVDEEKMVIPAPAGMVVVAEGKVYQNGKLYWERKPPPKPIKTIVKQRKKKTLKV